MRDDKIIIIERGECFVYYWIGGTIWEQEPFEGVTYNGYFRLMEVLF